LLFFAVAREKSDMRIRELKLSFHKFLTTALFPRWFYYIILFILERAAAQSGSRVTTLPPSGRKDHRSRSIQSRLSQSAPSRGRKVWLPPRSAGELLEGIRGRSRRDVTLQRGRGGWTRNHVGRVFGFHSQRARLSEALRAGSEHIHPTDKTFIGFYLIIITFHLVIMTFIS